MKWYQRLLKYPEVWVLTFAAFITRLVQLHLPSAVVFDETYFRTFASNYLSGNYFFDIHPPFVKLLFASAANVLHLEPVQLSGGDPAGAALRVIPALAGAALIPLVYVIVRQLGLGRRIAALGALLVLCDNALLVESRFVLMDSILLLAGFGALSCYLALRRSKGIRRWAWVVAVAVLLGVLVSTKWTGLAIAGLIAVAWLVDCVRQRADWRRAVGEAVIVVGTVATLYIGCFMMHFALLPNSGEGDAFMSKKFQSLLIDNPSYNPEARMAFLDKFVELNQEMYTAQSSLKGVEHPYASKWYTWPVDMRGVYFWQGQAGKDGIQGNIYMLGNPVVWWLSFAGVVAAFAVWVAKPKLLGDKRRIVAFLLAGYAVNFVPFAFIDRPMFLYHYLIPLIFSLLLTCVMLALLFGWQRQRFGAKAAQQTYWVIVAVVVLGFLYFIPLSYGWPLTPNDLQLRMWLPTWR